MGRLDGLSLLLVEDDEDSRDLLAMLFEDQGARVATADSIAGAIATLSDLTPDAILTDLTLPDGGGIELVTRLREDPKTARIPAIAVTGRTDSETRARAAEAGFQGFVTKPYDVSALAEEVLKAARTGRA